MFSCVWWCHVCDDEYDYELTFMTLFIIAKQVSLNHIMNDMIVWWTTLFYAISRCMSQDVISEYKFKHRIVPPSQLRLWYRPLSWPKGNIGRSLWKDMIWRIHGRRGPEYPRRPLVRRATRCVHLYDEDPLGKINNRTNKWT